MPGRTELRAKVFISCGQRTNEEKEIANDIKKELENRGFDTYVAVKQQDLKGLRENIFSELETSEYFLFIDFRREGILGSNDQEMCRGSLFANQELAIASYLGIQVIGFQEDGIVQRDGMMSAMQLNAIPFSERNTLVPRVMGEVEDKWKPNWKNALIMKEEGGPTDAWHRGLGEWGRFFHIRVRNLNPHKCARNCYAFLELVHDLSQRIAIQRETIELKWAKYTLPNATILPGSWRLIDGFFVLHRNPNIPRFNLFTDFSGSHPSIRGPGDYELTYLVVSENFQPIRATFRLHLPGNIDEVEFRTIEGMTDITQLVEERDVPIEGSSSTDIAPLPFGSVPLYSTASEGIQYLATGASLPSGSVERGGGVLSSGLRDLSGDR